MALIDEQHREARAQSLVSMPALRPKELGQDARKGEAGPKVGFGAAAAEIGLRRNRRVQSAVVGQ